MIASASDVLAAVSAGGFTLAERQQLAAAAFRHTATYDIAVASWLGNVVFAVYQIVPRQFGTLSRNTGFVPSKPLIGVVVATLAVACYGVDGERVDAVLDPGRTDAITPAAYRDSAEAVVPLLARDRSRK